VPPFRQLRGSKCRCSPPPIITLRHILLSVTPLADGVLMLNSLRIRLAFSTAGILRRCPPPPLTRCFVAPIDQCPTPFILFPKIATPPGALFAAFKADAGLLLYLVYFFWSRFFSLQARSFPRHSVIDNHLCSTSAPPTVFFFFQTTRYDSIVFLFLPRSAPGRFAMTSAGSCRFLFAPIAPSPFFSFLTWHQGWIVPLFFFTGDLDSRFFGCICNSF